MVLFYFLSVINAGYILLPVCVAGAIRPLLCCWFYTTSCLCCWFYCTSCLICWFHCTSCLICWFHSTFCLSVAGCVPLPVLCCWYFGGWQNFTANHSSTSAKYEKHDEIQFELSWTQLFEGQPPTIQWYIFLCGGQNFSLWTLFWKHHEGPTWMHLLRFRF